MDHELRVAILGVLTIVGLVLVLGILAREKRRKAAATVRSFDDITPGQLEQMIGALESNLAARLRAASAGSSFWGGLSGFVGLHTSDPVLIVAGVVLLAEGAYLYGRPSRHGLIIDALLLTFIGVWNIFASGGGFFLVLGLFQLAWAGNSVYLYVSRPSEHWPNQDAWRHTHRLLRFVKNTPLNCVDNIVEIGGARIAMFGDFVVTVEQFGGGAAVIPREQVSISQCTELAGGMKKATIKFADDETTTTMADATYSTLAAYVCAAHTLSSSSSTHGGDSTDVAS